MYSGLKRGSTSRRVSTQWYGKLWPQEVGAGVKDSRDRGAEGWTGLGTLWHVPVLSATPSLVSVLQLSALLLEPGLPVLSAPRSFPLTPSQSPWSPALLGDTGPPQEPRMAQPSPHTETRSGASGSDGPTKETNRGPGTGRPRPFWGAECSGGSRRGSRKVLERASPRGSYERGASKTEEGQITGHP